MRIFLTGATGYIGSAVLDALMRGGHQVTGLVRDPETAERLVRRGAKAIVGDLSKPAVFIPAAEGSDAIVHTASDHSVRREALDRQAIETLLAAAGKRADAGQTTAFVYTSGVWVLGDTQGRATEAAPVNPPSLVAWRPAHEKMVLDGAREGVIRTAIIRPGIVYGGARGIIGDLLKDAGNGLLRVIGDGHNHWPCIYDRDLADLYARVATQPGASGVFHANDEADERVEDIVEAIARHATDSARRPACAHRRGPLEDGAVCRRAGARSDRRQPARPRARLGADAALGGRQRGAAARRVQTGEGSRVTLSPRPPRRSVRSRAPWWHRGRSRCAWCRG